MAYYHPSDELLMAFAAGQLTNALGIMLSCHLEKCSQCQAKVKMYEQIGGELIDELTGADLAPGTLSNLLSQLDDPYTHATTKNLLTNDQRIPTPLRRFVPGYYDTLNWSGFSSSIQEFELPISDDQYTAKFYKISAGKVLPEHTHRGNEFTLVMEGSFKDKSGNYVPGDFILADSKTIHQPKAADECDCICFAVMDAPLKMTGFFGRLLNPFL